MSRATMLSRVGALASGLSEVTFLQDSFTDTNGVLLDAHTPDIGGAWEAMGWRGSTTTTGLVNGQISSNSFRSTASTTATRAYRNNTDPGLDNYYVEADWSFPILNNSFYDWRMYARMSPTGTGPGAVNRYEAEYLGNVTAGSRQYLLRKFVAGTGTTLATFTVDETGTTRRIRLQVGIGFQKVFRDGIEILSATDTEITQRGRVGALAPGNSSGGRIDDLLAVAA